MNEHELRKLDRLANWMDNAFPIPGTNMRIGLDGLFGLFPVLGDSAGLAVSAYIIHKAHKAGMHPTLIGNMIGNVMVDWAIGLVPFIGDIFDVGWKANRRNVDIIKEHVRTGELNATKKDGVYTV